MSTKHILSVIIFVAIGGLLLFFLSPDSSTKDKLPSTPKLILITEKIEYNGLKADKTATISAQKDKNVLDILTKTMPIAYKQYSNGKKIQSIDDIENETNGKSWTLYIDGQLATASANSIKIAPNQLIEWRFENSQ